MHGPTYMANPLACAVASASLDLIATGEWQAQVANIEQWLHQYMMPCSELDAVADIRILGAIGVVETKVAVDVGVIQAKFVESGVWIRPFGKLVYIMPPFISTQAHIEQLCNAIYSALDE